MRSINEFCFDGQPIDCRWRLALGRRSCPVMALAGSLPTWSAVARLCDHLWRVRPLGCGRLGRHPVQRFLAWCGTYLGCCRRSVGWSVAAVAGASPTTLKTRPNLAYSRRRRVPSCLMVRAEAGGALPGVAVTATLHTGGDPHRATTGSDGTYEFKALPEGDYQVDFDLTHFNVIRRNGIRVRRDAATHVEVMMHIKAMCECVELGPRGIGLQERAGRVVSDTGRPLLYALLEVRSQTIHESAYADREGLFRVMVPSNEPWVLTASTTGFQPESRQVRSADAAPLISRLPAVSSAPWRDLQEFRRGCHCLGDVFRHQGR